MIGAKERVAEQKRQHRLRGGEAMKRKERADFIKWCEAHPEHRLWLGSKGRAKRAGLEFTI